MAVLYVVAAWLIMQVAEVLIGLAKLPDWIGTTTLWLLAVGFPIALVFSWFYEVTPEGVSLEKDVEPGESITHITGRRLDFLVISMLCAAVILFAYDKWWIGPPPEQSIAVLPFDNRSNREEDAYFADGIQDDLLTKLAKISTLKVISRTSVERYRNSDKSIPEIARELDVATLLEGGIQRSADQLRINVQLIDAQTDQHLWAETYDRELTAENLFAIQSEISREIVTALHHALTDAENERLQAMPTTSLEAYAEVVLGRQEQAKRTADALYRAQAHFEKAIELDTEYALAYVGLADTLALQVAYAGITRSDSLAPRQAAIDKALALDPLSGEAYTSLALLSSDDKKNEEAEAYFLKAIELNPNYVTAHLWYNILLRRAGRWEEALSHIRTAVELDPMAPILTENLASNLYFLGRVEEAEAVLLKGIERNPEFPGLHLALSNQMYFLGRVGESMNGIRTARRLAPNWFGSKIQECYRYLDLGDNASAERCYESAAKDFPDQVIDPRIWFYVVLQPRKAADLLDQMAQRELHRDQKDLLAFLYFQSGDVDEARSIWQDLWPELYGDEDVVMSSTELVQSHPVLTRIASVAYTLQVNDQQERANELFEHVLAATRSRHRTRGLGYGTLDVFIHTVRGDKQKAISALREAVDMGWREDWHHLLYLPFYESMRAEPEWIELINELEADIARQRLWYEEHKDEPSF
jgi:TolB-like protein/Flp pilus assembly protein TadD